jgi:hypothetical protein
MRKHSFITAHHRRLKDAHGAPGDLDARKPHGTRQGWKDDSENNFALAYREGRARSGSLDPRGTAKETRMGATDPAANPTSSI